MKRRSPAYLGWLLVGFRDVVNDVDITLKTDVRVHGGYIDNDLQ